MDYTDKPEDIAADAKDFLGSEYGMYKMQMLQDMIDGALSSTADVKEPYPERFAARYSALKEVKESFESDLGIDAPAIQK